MAIEDECWEVDAFRTDNYVVTEIARKADSSSYYFGKHLTYGSFLALVGTGRAPVSAELTGREKKGGGTFRKLEQRDANSRFGDGRQSPITRYTFFTVWGRSHDDPKIRIPETHRVDFATCKTPLLI